MLTTALWLASCSTTRRTLQGSERATQQSALYTHLDSTAHRQLQTALERIATLEAESVTHLVIYDTERTDSSGNPPVKVLLRKDTRHSASQHEQSATHAQERKALSADTLTTTSCHWEQTSTKETAPTTHTRRPHWLLIAALTLLTAAAYTIYKRIKSNK